ncbi:MAG: zeta toxin family protein, partial [Desulfovibrio sp.]|nr:zeta toxin family protein [Desulfovibrio sp.]
NNPETSTSNTQIFASKITERLIQYFIENRYNIVIQGTFRNPDVPIKTLRLLSAHSYKTIALVLTCDKKLSWNSCEHRYFSAVENDRILDVPTRARKTSKEKHDYVAEHLAENVATVYEACAAERMIVFLPVFPMRPEDLREKRFSIARSKALLYRRD